MSGGNGCVQLTLIVCIAEYINARYFQQQKTEEAIKKERKHKAMDELDDSRMGKRVKMEDAESVCCAALFCSEKQYLLNSEQDDMSDLSSIEVSNQALPAVITC